MNWKEAALKHAKEEDPQESCGLLLCQKGKERYWPCKNIADLPTEGFCIDPDDWMKGEDTAEVIGVIHSHPDCPPTPSPVDLSSCEYIDLPFHICNPRTEAWHSFNPSGYKTPLIGRQWTWGASDCWTLIIDYFAEQGLEVKDWERPKRSEEILTNDIFCEQNFIESGFVPLEDDAEWLVGDLLLFKFTGPSPDHVGIYIGQKGLHHMGGKLSSRDPLNEFLINAIVRRYRHAKKN